MSHRANDFGLAGRLIAIDARTSGSQSVTRFALCRRADETFDKAFFATKMRLQAAAIMTVGQSASAHHPAAIALSKLTRLCVPPVSVATACAPATLILFDNAALNG